MSRWGEFDSLDDEEPGSVCTGVPEPMHYVTDRIKLDRSELPPPPRIPCGSTCQRLNGEPSCGQCGALRLDNPPEND